MPNRQTQPRAEEVQVEAFWGNGNDVQIAVIKKDISQIREQLGELKADLYEEMKELQADIKIIKSYFVRAMFGIGAVVGTYFVQWLLKGGISNVVGN